MTLKFNDKHFGENRVGAKRTLQKLISTGQSVIVDEQKYSLFNQTKIGFKITSL